MSNVLPPDLVPAWIRTGAERLRVLQSRGGRVPSGSAPRSYQGEQVAFVYGFPTASEEPSFLGPGAESLGPVPQLIRPLRLGYAAERLSLPSSLRSLVPEIPLVAPFGRKRRAAVREITARDPRLTRLWERFSIDVGVSVERDAAFITRRIFDRPEAGYRVLIVEDGDRYAIRAVCIFVVKDEEAGRLGYVLEVLHDRSVEGMRAASHLLGLAVREMSDAGAEALLAWSMAHSGSFPVYARHAFLPLGGRLRPRDVRFGVRVLDPTLDEIVLRRDRWYLSYLDDDTV